LDLQLRNKITPLKASSAVSSLVLRAKKEKNYLSLTYIIPLLFLRRPLLLLFKTGDAIQRVLIFGLKFPHLEAFDPFLAYAHSN
jgi:hypothetical protein